MLCMETHIHIHTSNRTRVHTFYRAAYELSIMYIQYAFLHVLQQKRKEASSINLLDCYYFLMNKGFLFIVGELGAY